MNLKYSTLHTTIIKVVVNQPLQTPIPSRNSSAHCPGGREDIPTPLDLAIRQQVLTLEFPQDYHPEKGQTWCQQEKGLLSQKKISSSSDKLLGHFVGETGAKTIMGE